MSDCSHDRVSIGLDAAYCPDCKHEFASFTAEYAAFLNRKKKQEEKEEINKLCLDFARQPCFDKAQQPCQNSAYSIALQASAPSLLQQNKLEELPLHNSLKSETTNNQSCDRTSQTPQSTPTSVPSMQPVCKVMLTSGVSESLVHPLVEQDKKEHPMTNATCSQTPSESSLNANQNGSSSKTQSDCLIAPTPQESNQAHFLDTYCDRFPVAGTWANGWFYPQPALDCHTIVEGSLLLPTPTALSSKNSRPPGQNKLEVKLKQLGMIAPGETVNPELLEMMLGFPVGYTLPQELKAEIVPTAEEEKSVEIQLQFLAPKLHLNVFYILTTLLVKEYETMVEILPSETLVGDAGAENNLHEVPAVIDLITGGTIAAAEELNNCIEYLSLNEIAIDGGTQSRLKLDDATVSEYAGSMAVGVEFPPVTVFYDGQTYWLADGFHRIAAARKAEVEDIAVDVRQGTRRDAVLYSVGANATHGLPRSNADKRRAVQTLLVDAEWREWSNNKIAKICGVSLDLVNRLRKESSLNESLSEKSLSDNSHLTKTANSLSEKSLSERTYTTKHGTTAKMRTNKIGKSKLQAAPVLKVGDRVTTDDPDFEFNGDSGTIASVDLEWATVKMSNNKPRSVPVKYLQLVPDAPSSNAVATAELAIGVLSNAKDFSNDQAFAIAQAIFSKLTEDQIITLLEMHGFNYGYKDLCLKSPNQKAL